MVASDSDGDDSSGEPKRARFLDVFIAHRLQTQEGMAGKEIWEESSAKQCIRVERVQSNVFHSSKHELSISGINSHIGQLHKNQRKVHVHRLAHHFGSVSLSLNCY